MVLQKGLSILLHAIASAGVLTPLGDLDNLMTYDNTEEAVQARKYRETQRYQALRKIATLKQLDASQLPLIATDQSAFERALLEIGATANQSKSHAHNRARNSARKGARNNESSSKQKILAATEIHIKPWNHKAFAAEFRSYKETIS